MATEPELLRQLTASLQAGRLRQPIYVDKSRRWEHVWWQRGAGIEC
jgi:hypothetical protein